MRIAAAALPLLLAACSFGTNPATEEAAREQANVAVIQGLYDAFAQGDMDAVLGTFAPDVEWVESEGSPYAGTFRGPDAVLNGVFTKLGNDWEVFRVAPSEFLSDGDRVVALGTYTGTHRATGRSFQAAFAHAWTVQDARITHFQQIADNEMIQRAIEPAGEPANP